MITLWRILLALAAWAALALQYWLMITGQPPAEVAARTVNFFSYFTILTNLLVAMTATAPMLAPGSTLGKGLGSPSPRAAAAMFITVVCLVYHVVLRQLWDPQGWQKVVDYALHYVVPIAFLLDWLLLVPKGMLSWRAPVRWLAYPLVYAAWTLVHGHLSGFWPYPFVDAGAIGLQRVLLNMGGFVLAFLGLGLAFVGIDRLLGLMVQRRDP
ncbi:MAG: Pr6Pr family membrane protein [Caulobacter sp.]